MTEVRIGSRAERTMRGTRPVENQPELRFSRRENRCGGKKRGNRGSADGKTEANEKKDTAAAKSRNREGMAKIGKENGIQNWLSGKRETKGGAN